MVAGVVWAKLVFLLEGAVVEGEAHCHRHSLTPASIAKASEGTGSMQKTICASVQWCHIAELPSITPLQSHIPKTVNLKELLTLVKCTCIA